MSVMTGDGLQAEILRGESLFLENKVDEAFEVFESVSRHDPQNVEALNNLGVVLNARKEFGAAIDTFARVLRLQSDHAQAAFNLISNYLATSDWKAAEQFFYKYSDIFSAEDGHVIANAIMELKCSPQGFASLITLPLTITHRGGQHTLKLLLDIEKYSQRIIWNHLKGGDIYEWETLQYITDILEEGDCFVDVGAHIGYFALFASRFVGTGGQVIAIEPEVQNAVHLLKHVSINHIENMCVIRSAVGADNTTTEFFVNADNDGGHALWDPGLHPFNEKTRDYGVARKTRLETLDRILKSNAVRPVKAMKIDTEGAELEVVKGALTYLSENEVPHVICEINKFGLSRMGAGEKALRGVMHDLGYEAFWLDSKEGIPVKLNRDEYIESAYVFNMLFKK